MNAVNVGKFISQLRKEKELTQKELAEKLGRESCRTGGARNLRHLIQEQVEGPLAVHLLQAAKQPEKVEGVLRQASLEFIS